ncbi:MAG TPA: pyridoxamine 5'-phosphate oxidase family protein [Acidimicrobiia bacterium]
MREQRRGRKIAMTADEVDAYLAVEHTCTVATIGPTGPHATALWFVWDGTSLWLYSITRSRRWVDLERDPRVAVLVEAGEEYFELRGVEMTGQVEQVGDVPRTATDDPDLVEIERLFAAKYQRGLPEMFHDGRHAWLRLTPSKITSWDFRKINQ